MWVGSCVTALAAWASPPGRRGPHRRGDDAGVYTDRWKWPLGAVLGHSCTLLRRGLGLWVALGSQQCTQMGGSGLSAPFRGICVHCWAVASSRRDAGVYTNRWKWPLGAVSGHLCTLLRRELRRVARAPQPPWRAGGASSLAPLAWSGRQALREWRRCQAGIFAEASTHTNPRRARYRALSWMVRCC